MEERELEFDDDGKIKVRKGGALPGEGAEGEPDEIVIELHDFDDEPEAPTEEEELRRAAIEEERADRRARAAQALDEADALFEEGDFDAAGEKYLDSAALNGADWRPWFGVVRVQTRDLTDFSGIYECERAYDKAFRRMPAAARAALAEKYVPALSRRADECAVRHEQLTEEDNRLRAEAHPAAVRADRRYTFLFSAFTVLFALLVIAGSCLVPFVRSVPGNGILIPAIVCFAAAAALLAAVVVFFVRFLRARTALRHNKRAGTTPAGEEARVLAETEELIRSIIDDLNK